MRQADICLPHNIAEAEMGTIAKRHGLCSTNSSRALSGRARARRVLACSAAVGIASYLAPHPAMAGTNGTWAGPVGGGPWSTTLDWATGIIAQGQDAVATFSNTSGGVVHLDTNVGGIGTVGKLIFNTSTWTLDNNGTAANLLTLSTSTGQPIIDVLGGTTTISASISGTQGFDLNPGTTAAGILVLSGANTGLSGTVLLNRGDLDVDTSNALGSSNVTINPNVAGGADTRLVVPVNGLTIPNNITMLSSNVGGGNNGSILVNTGDSATFTGTITIEAVASSGGHISSTAPGGTGTGFINFTGPIINTLSPNYGGVGNSGNSIIVRAGNLNLAGGGSYYRIDERTGTIQLGANNGIATDAIVNLGGNGNATLDMNGFSQTVTAVSQLIATNTVNVINSSATKSSTLTFAPNASTLVVTGPGGTAPSGNFVNITFGGVISDTTGATLSLVENSLLNTTINGTGTPVGTPNTTGVTTLTGANTYHGTTTLTAGTLAVSTLAAGGTASGIGESTNAATNLVFGGGTLQYLGGTASTDRNFTINAGSTGTINVSTAATSLTISGGSSPTTGSLIKTGLGTLVLSGTNGHTGTTSVNGGALIVDGSLSASSAVSIASGATLGGIGNVNGTVTPAVGGIISPGNLASVGTLNVGTLTLNTGSVVNFEFGTGNDEITATNANLNGGSLDLFTVGTTNAFTTTGTYPLFNVTNLTAGAFSNLSIANAQAGVSYALSNTGVLTIGTASISEWTSTSSNQWSGSASNWTPSGIPNGASTTVKFATAGAGEPSVVLSGPETVGAMIFTNAASYNISGATLTLDNGSAASPISVSGTQTLATPISLNSAMAISTSVSGDTLTVSGNISGAKTLSMAGPGTVTLTGTNSYGNTTVLGGTLNVGAVGGGATGSLGTGNLSLASGTVLNFNLSSAYSFPGGIAGPGAVSQLGTGSIAIGGAISGITTANISSGTLTAASTLDQSGGVNVTGIGSLTVSGGITGAGALTVNTSGTVSVGGTSTYAGATTLTAGALVLNSSNALPTGSTLAVNGGVLDLHGNSISLGNVTDAAAGGTITNNVPSSTSTITFSGNQASYNIFAALNDGASGGKVALVSSIANTVSGSAFFLRLNSVGTYSGGTTIISQAVAAEVTGALGSGPISIPGGNSSTNTSRVLAAGGVTLPNAINIGQGNPGGNLGVVGVDAMGSGNSTITGTVTVNSDNFSGSTFAGPTGSIFLNVNGPVIAAGTATNISVAVGNVQINNLSATPNVYPAFTINGGAVSIAANNGILPTAVLNANAGTFDLNGYNQTVAAVTGAGTITFVDNGIENQNPTGSSSTLTVNTSNTYSDSSPDTFSGSLTGNGITSGSLSLVKTGVGTLLLTGSINQYVGGTVITQGVLAAANLSTIGGNAGSVGLSGDVTGGTSNVVFNGGTLRYTGTSATTDQTFAINPGITGILDVSNSSTALTWTGSSGTTTGSFIKVGAGTLIIDSTANEQYSGNTTVSAGTLLVNGTVGTTGSGHVSVASGAVLGGTGTVSGALDHTAGIITGATAGTSGTLTFTDPVTLDGGTAQFDINTALLTLGAGVSSAQDLIVANGGLSVASSSKIDMEFSGTTPANGSTFTYPLFDYTGTALTTAQANLLHYTTNLGRGSTFTTVLAPGVVEVNVVVGSGGANLKWNSTSSGVWDVQNTANWLNGASSDVFFQGDNVTFGDGAGLQTNISLNTSVQPGTMLVNSNTNNYTISGTGQIFGTNASLTKTGSSTLTISTVNNYAGGTTISGGLLSLGTGGSLGTGPITFNGGTLQYSAFGTPTDISPQINASANTSQAINIDTNGQSVTWATGITGGSDSVTKTGAGILNLTGNNTYTGNTTVNAGTLAVTSQSSLGGNGNIVLNGGTLSAPAITLTNNLVIGAGGATLSNTGTAIFTGSLTGTGTINSSTTNADIFSPSSGTAPGTFAGTVISNNQVNLTEFSASPAAAYVANFASPNTQNTFTIGGSPPVAVTAPIQLGSLSGIAGSYIRNGNTAGIGPVVFQIGALNTNTTFAGNIEDSEGGDAGNTVSITKVGSGTLTLSGSTTYTGATVVSGGTLTFAKVNTGVGAVVRSTLTLSAGTELSVASSTPISGSNPNRTVLVANSLTNSGKVDLGSNDMIVHSGANGESVAATINSQVATGRGTNGAWTGTGITSSAAAASPSNMALAVVLNDANQSGTLSGTPLVAAASTFNHGLTTFDGQAVADGDVLVKYTYYGDALLTGSVTAADYIQIDAGFASQSGANPLTGWFNGDFNYDGKINGDDYTLIDNAFNTQGSVSFTEVSAGPAEQIATVSSVPEPGSVSLLAIGAAGLLRRRRRRV
jgi:fibronectin-binding autotransporter adhesin